MIESALFFALGFLVAGLLALMIVPSIWRRAVRLTRLEIEATAPLSLAEIRANRDQMRAEFARETRRLELAAGEMRRRAAERQIEASRQRDRAGAMAAERDALAARLAAVEAEFAARVEEFDRGRATVEEARRVEETQSGELTELKIRLADLVAELDTRKVEAAALKTTIESLEQRAANLNDERKQAVYRAEVAEGEVAKRDAQIADDRDRVRRLDAALAERARELTGRTDELAVAGDRLARAEARIADLQAEIARLRDGFADEETRMVGMRLGDNAARTVESLERANGDLRARIEALTAERDAVTAALAAKDREIAAAGGAGTEVLRERLADLAARLVASAGKAEGAGSPIAALVAEPEADPEAGAGRPAARRKRRTLADRIREVQKQDPAEAPPA